MKPYGVCLIVGLVLLLGETNAVKRCKYLHDQVATNLDMRSIAGIGNIADCCQQCLSDPSCHGFAVWANACYLKAVTTPINTPPPGVVQTSGIIQEVSDEQLAAEEAQPTTCLQAPGMGIDAGHDLRVDLRASTMEECCNYCKSNIDCRSVSMWNGGCYMKYVDGPAVPMAGVNSAVVRSGPPPIATGPVRPPPPPAGACRVRRLQGSVSYEQLEGQNISPGRDIAVRGSPTFEACAKNCIMCDGCVAFIFDLVAQKCYLKDNQNVSDEYNENLQGGILDL